MKFINTILVCLACLFLGQAYAQTDPSTVTVNGYTYNKCADEHNQCSFTVTRNILYGAWPPVDSTAQYAQFGPYNLGIFCDNAHIGSDPAIGFLKACYYTQQNPTTVQVGNQMWTQCGVEHGTCTWSTGGTQTILYGAFPPNDTTSQSTTVANQSSGVGCDNNLTADPAPGYQKACYIASGNPTTVIVNGTTWTKCADEHSTTNGVCNFTGSQQVLYGSFPPVDPTNQYAIRGPFTNSVPCDNTNLGPDPAVGFAKSCYTSGVAQPTATLTANPTTITSGQSSTLTLTSTNATSCSGPVSGTSGTTTVSPTSTTTYTETCTGASGTNPATATATVTVTSHPFTPPTLVNPQNPMNYGAACNGSTDDTGAFQSAANAGDILVPAGKTCVINGNLWINGSNHHLQCGDGYGMDNTTLKRTVNNNYGMISFGSSNYGNGIHYTGDSITGCNFIGTNTVAPQFQLGTLQFDIPVETYGMVDNFFLAGNTFKQFWGQSMFQTYSSGNAGTGDNIEYNTFQSCGYYGPVFDAHTNGTIQNNTMIDCAAGVENDNSSQATGGNIIQNNTSTAVSCYGAPDMTSSVMITGGVAGGANYGTNIVRNNTVSGTSNSSCVHGAGLASHIIIGANFSPPHTSAQYSNNTCNNGCTVEP